MKHTTENCGCANCCEGVEVVTPQQTTNRPGLTSLNYRVGEYATFLESMLARLSSQDYPKLAELTTREKSDASITLMDAWSTVGDVLTFYNERIINEAYLRTATERRSILELARLVGYQLRPGVASSVYLAYNIDRNYQEEVTIPKGARSQSIPAPGELPQSFEIIEDLKARAQWNNLKPRLTKPQTKDSIKAGDGVNARVFLKGISTNLKPNDPMLIEFTQGSPVFFRVKEVKPDAAANTTMVVLQETATPPAATATGIRGHESSSELGIIDALTLAPSIQPANALRLNNQIKKQFPILNDKKSIENQPALGLICGDSSHAMLKTFAPLLERTLVTAISNAQVTPLSAIKVYALRIKASLFGHNAPKLISVVEGIISVIGDWPVIEHVPSVVDTTKSNELANTVFLDASYESILPDSWMVVKTPHTRLTKNQTFITKAIDTNASLSRAEYGITGSTTEIKLDRDWITLNPLTAADSNDDFDAIRGTVVYAQSEELELAEQPIEESVCGGMEELIELDGVYDGLEAGRWVVVSGERSIAGTGGVRFSELAMLASVAQNVGSQVREPIQSISAVTAVSTPKKFETKIVASDGDQIRTFIMLANKLAYCFKRDTITIYGNVANATHGETRTEVLGSGNGAQALQSFILKQPPLTYVSAAKPSGIDSTLQVFVNDVKWHEVDALAGLAANDRKFITKTDNEGKTTVAFGNGREGARLPTGIENIKAQYRNGIGKAGNVKAEQISLLVSRPLGVKEVINPLLASGGADKESRDQARKNAPLAVKALDRLVSVQDYEDFSRTYAGIGKATATELSNGRRQIIYITIAGVEDAPIEKHSDLYRNLKQTLHDFGDPYQAIQLELRELLLIVLSAKIKIHPDYQWEPVIAQVRNTLLNTFSFENRELGQDVMLSEIISATQNVRGVAYVDVDVFGGVPEKQLSDDKASRQLLTPADIAFKIQSLTSPKGRLNVNLADFESGLIHPAQIAFITPDVPATLILNQIP